MHAWLTRSFLTRVSCTTGHNGRYRWEFTNRAPSTCVRDTKLSSWISNYVALLKCIFVLSSEFPECVGWMYNMSHGGVLILPPSVPFFETACPSRASEGVPFAVSRSSSFACVFQQHEVLVSLTPTLQPLGPRRTKLLSSFCRINIAFHEHSRTSVSVRRRYIRNYIKDISRLNISNILMW